jgi:hypothetical protein
MNRLRVEFWWTLEQWSGWLWNKYCPEDKASYWLDGLPAFTMRQRHAAERRTEAIAGGGG